MAKSKRSTEVNLGKKRFRYTVVIGRETDPNFHGYYNAYVPALPGCVSYGKSPKETLQNIREAITSYLLSLLNEGETLPKDVKPEIKVVEVTV